MSEEADSAFKQLVKAIREIDDYEAHKRKRVLDKLKKPETLPEFTEEKILDWLSQVKAYVDQPNNNPAYSQDLSDERELIELLEAEIERRRHND